MLCTLHVLATQSVVRRPATSSSACDLLEEQSHAPLPACRLRVCTAVRPLGEAVQLGKRALEDSMDWYCWD